jgi:hypothetical protein
MRIAEHVRDCIRGLRRRAEDVRVVAVCEDFAGALELAIQRSRDPDQEALNASRECHCVARLHDEVNVIGLHGEMHDAKSIPLAPCANRVQN